MHTPFSRSLATFVGRFQPATRGDVHDDVDDDARFFTLTVMGELFSNKKRIHRGRSTKRRDGAICLQMARPKFGFAIPSRGAGRKGAKDVQNKLNNMIRASEKCFRVSF